MPGTHCCICSQSTSQDPHLSFHRFPKDDDRRRTWLEAFSMQESDVKVSMRVCSRHFPDGDSSKIPSLNLGKRMASPIKKGPRSKRARRRDAMKTPSISPSPTPSCSSSASGLSTPRKPDLPLLVTTIGEQLQSDYSIHELPSTADHHTDVLVETALVARIECLEAENRKLKSDLEREKKTTTPFRIECINTDDSLVRFYTGFISFSILLAFYEFLGPAVDQLNYWGSKISEKRRRRAKKLSSLNQFFLMLIKLRLNLKTKDLACRFGISSTQVSRIITTWICFIYQHIKELDWIPSVKQVTATLPNVFRQKYPSTYAIIDGSEIFIQTPSDLHLQSSTWSQYKHHNTTKMLIACTPNGSICFISPLFVGSISDVELTKVSGFLEKLEGKSGISIMADRGFTIKDLLKELNIDLNIPPFMEGRPQLPPTEVTEGRRIASLRIHVERAIGRIKTYAICRETIPLNMARLCNQIVCVCGFLSNFQPALVPTDKDIFMNIEDDEDDKYWDELTDSDSDEEI